MMNRSIREGVDQELSWPGPHGFAIAIQLARL